MLAGFALPAGAGAGLPHAAEKTPPDLASRLERVEADPVRSDPGEITSIVEACRRRAGIECEARALLARAECLAQSPPVPEVQADAAAAEALLRPAGPSGDLARALLLMRGAGAPDPAGAAAKTRERLEEAIGIAQRTGAVEIEGRARCELIRSDLFGGQAERARRALADLERLAAASESPRVRACAAYFEGLSRYFGRDPRAAREAWERYAGGAGAERAPRELLWILVGAAAASIDLGDAPAAVSHARRAVDLGVSLAGKADLLPAHCNLSSALYLIGRIEESEVPARACLELARESGRRDGEALGLRRLGDAAALRGESSKALSLFDASLEITRSMKNDRETAWGLVSRGQALTEMGRLEEARRDLEEAVSIADRFGDPIQRSYARAGLARVLALRGDPNAERLATEALEIGKAHESAAGTGMALRARGLARLNRQVYGAALRDYREAYRIFEAAGRPGWLGATALDIGNIYYWLFRHDLALKYYREALEDSRAARDATLRLSAVNNLEMLRRHYRTGEEEVEALRRSALEAAELRAPGLEANALVNLAETLANLGEHAAAETAALRAVRAADEAGAPETRLNARSRLAVIRSWLGKHEEASRACESLLAAAAGRDLHGEAQAGFRCGWVSLRAGRADEAVRRFRAALAAVEDARRTLSQPEFRAAFTGGKEGFYAALADALLQRAGPGPSEEALAEILQVSERVLARNILESLIADHVAGQADPGRETAAEGRHALLTRMAEVHLRGAGATGEEARAALQEIRDLEEKLGETRSTPQEAPGDSLLGASAASLDSIREGLLDGSTAALEYLPGFTRSFVIAVTAERIAVAAMPPVSEWREQVLRYRGLLRARGSDPDADESAIRALGERLYHVLISPVADLLGPAISRLIVVPAADLAALPFEALVAPGAGEKDRPTYLVERYEIVMAPSLGVLLALQRLPRREEGGEIFAGFANPATLRAPTARDEGAPEEGVVFPSGLPELRYSEEEVRLAARHLGAEAELRTGAEVTEASVRRALASGVRVVHVAAHGFLDAGSTGRSGLLLTPDEESGDDGLLQAREIVDLPVRADLVVLSGCSTGSGKLVWGEGPMGLSHALLQAGARGLVKSLWDVRDRAAAIFMDRFYSALGRALPPAGALRQAKLDLLESGRRDLAHPSVWAPFVFEGIGWQPLVAAGRPPPRGSGTRPVAGLVLLAAAALASLAVLAFRGSRRRSRSGPPESGRSPGAAPPAPPPAT